MTLQYLNHFQATMIILMIILIPAANALRGYDCGGEGLNITSLSLVDMGDCNTEDIEPIRTETYLQLMQLSDYDKTKAIQCKIEVDRNIYYCGMHSHISVVHNARREYIQEIGEQACRRLHDTGTITMGNTVIDRIINNGTNLRSITLAGSTTMDGRCTGTQYTDGYGNWENVIVQASVKITMKSFEASVKRSTGSIILLGGAQCKIAEGYCIDAEGSETYWTPLPMDSCHFDRYDILYEGMAIKLSPKENDTAPTIYTVTAQDVTFALTRVTDFSLCGYQLIQTEHPKLFILETQKGRTFRTRSKIAVDNLDIFTYVNSKFVYVEKHIKTQLTQLYRNIMEQKCSLEKQILQNALSLASIAPDEMAYRIAKGPGHTAVVSGEVIHLIKCVPVECKVRYTEECYNELPVSHQNQSLFLLPKSHILTRKGTPRSCSNLLPTSFKINGAWFRLIPKPTETLPPPVIQPLTHATWKYASPFNLAAGGIYSTEELERLRAHIMFPIEKPSMLSTLAKGAMGERIPAGSVSMLNLLDEGSLERIAESAGEKAWKGFVTFGSASAGVLAIFIIIRVAKLLIDTAIHGYALHSMYGWSVHLLGAVWSSVTHLLLHLGGQPNEKDQDAEIGPTPSSPDPEDTLGIKRMYVDDKRLYSYSYLNKKLQENESSQEKAGTSADIFK